MGRAYYCQLALINNFPQNIRFVCTKKKSIIETFLINIQTIHWNGNTENMETTVIRITCGERVLISMRYQREIYEGQSKITESWLISFYWVGSFG